MDRPETLYHYTTLDTFYEIVRNKELWLCDILDSNDSEEQKAIDKTVNEWIDSLNSQSTFLFGELELAKKKYDLYKASAHVMCFSEHSDALSQWSEYGDSCKGISIGFNMDLFKINADIVKLSFTGDDLGIIKVVYYNEDEKEKLRQEISKDTLRIRAILEQIGIVDNTEGLRAKQDVIIEIADMAYSLANRARYYKNKSFQSEKEWRIIYLPMIENECSNSTFRIHGSIKEINFMKNKRFRTYFKYKLPVENNSNPFKEIILGAKADIDEKKIKMFLHANGFWGTEIKRSQIPYR